MSLLIPKSFDILILLNRRLAAITMGRLVPINSLHRFQQELKLSLTGGKSATYLDGHLMVLLVNGPTPKDPSWFTWPNARDRAHPLTAPALIGSRSPKQVRRIFFKPFHDIAHCNT